MTRQEFEESMQNQLASVLSQVLPTQNGGSDSHTESPSSNEDDWADDGSGWVDDMEQSEPYDEVSDSTQSGDATEPDAPFPDNVIPLDFTGGSNSRPVGGTGGTGGAVTEPTGATRATGQPKPSNVIPLSQRRATPVADLGSQEQDWAKIVGDVMKLTVNDIQEMKEKAYKDRKTNNQSKVSYGSGKTTIGGSTVDYKYDDGSNDATPVDFSMYKNKQGEYFLTPDEFPNIRNIVTRAIIDKFGLERIKNIAVSANQLIINGVAYVPKMDSGAVARFPLDCKEYVESGLMAPFFDWSWIVEFQRLTTLKFDSYDFVMDYVAQDFGVGRDFNPLSLFKKCQNLSMLQIEDDVVTYPLEPNDDVSRSAAEHVRKEARFFSKWDEGYEGYKARFCSGAEGVHRFFHDSVASYVRNRGDKGFLRYALGTVTRTAGWGISGIVEGAVKVGGWATHGIVNLLKGDGVDTMNGQSMEGSVSDIDMNDDEGSF